MLTLRTRASSLHDATSLQEEVAKLRQTVRLLELERSSTKNVCQKAIEVLDQQHRHPSAADEAQQQRLAALEAELVQQREQCQQRQVEIDKLRGREQHFRESNEIFQQKLQLLTDENRKLRGQRQLVLY